MDEATVFPDLESLEDIRKGLTAGLAEALELSAGGRLSPDEAQHAARSAVEGHGLSPQVTEIFRDEPVAALVGFDADRIQSWVFASERIQVAAGASKLLEDLNEGAFRYLARECGLSRELGGPIYSAGGAGILLASSQVVQNAAAENDFCDAVVRCLEEQCPSLTFTAAAVPLYAWDLETSGDKGHLPQGPAHLERFQVATGLKGALSRLQTLVRERKDSQPKLGPERLKRDEDKLLATRCPSCGLRTPDNPVGEGEEPTPANWCRWCRDVSGAVRTSDRRFKDEDGNPITFADLAGRVQQPRQYLGFLALDGNGLGHISRQMGSLVELCAFSRAVTAIYQRARRQGEKALEQFITGLDESRTSAAHLSLLSGGDEITLVLPAGAAPRVSHVVALEVERGFDLLTKEGGYLHRAFSSNLEVLSALRASGSGAGLVLADSHFPVRFLRRYAGLLQKRAKKACEAGGHRSAIAWEMLTEGSPLTEELGDGPQEEDLSLAGLDQQLEDVVAGRVAGLGRAALQTIFRYRRAEALGLESVAPAELRREVLSHLTANFFRYQLARNPELARWWAVTGKPEPGSGDLAKWLRDGGALKLERLLALYSLVPLHRSRRAA